MLLRTSSIIVIGLLTACSTFFIPFDPGDENSGSPSTLPKAETVDDANDLQPYHSYGATYTAAGELNRPTGWRKWVYVGTPLTPHDMNDGKAAFPEFHNVYVDPESFATFERTGKFPNGTQIVKELVLVGSKEAVSGQGYFMGEFAGLEVAIKDTVRFKDEPGGWAYFSFGHVSEDKYAKTAKKFPASACNACHEASADTDFVFTQYYPVLMSALPKKEKQKIEAAKKNDKKMDGQALRSAMNAVGESSTNVKPDEYSDKLFKWLQDGHYKKYKSESRVHPSAAGKTVHGDVKTFVNDKLDKSMLAGNKSHPIGSVAVKELYKDGKMIGWALALKAKKDDGKGNGWYWYENLSTKNNRKPVAASLGNSLCVGCHSPGNDFVRIKKIE